MRMSRRMGIYSSNLSVEVSVYGAASETVTLTDAKGKEFSVTTNANGEGGTLKLPFGEYTVKGSHTNYSKSVTVDRDTTKVFAMPDGTIVYWYGYMPYTPVASELMPSGETNNGKAPEIAFADRSFNVKQESASGNYCGSAIFENVNTEGGVPTLLSSGKLNVAGSPPNIYFSYATSIESKPFTAAETKRVGYGETNVTLASAAAGTYDIAISARNNGIQNHGQIDVYAVYFAK